MKQTTILYLLGALLFCNSCKKFLEEKPQTFLTPDNFYQTAADATAALNGVFSGLEAQAYYGRTTWIISENSADLLYSPNSNSDRYTLYLNTYTSTNGEIANWWNSSYKMIKGANDVIAHVPNVKMDTVARNNIVGNARFLRAMAYFDLVRSFGDVPLVTAPIVGSTDTNLYPHRMPSAKVYQQIISDLQYAESNCPAENKISSGNKGYVSTGAASAMLARVYLTRASTSFADPNDNQNALAECNKVLGYSYYNLLPTYQDIFDCAKKYGPEHIFCIQFGLPPSTGNITLRMFTPQALGGSASFFCQNNFFNTGYSADDSIRRNWNVANKALSITTGKVVSATAFFYKYRDSLWTNQSNNSRVNWIVLRLADVYLMQSEAMNNIDPTNPAKFNGLNTVRARAGLKDPATQQLNMTNTPTASAFVDSLVADRARELCVEGERRWDLIRLGRFKQRMATLLITIDDAHMLLAIPQAELQVNKNLTQNPGLN
jgi:hypothetical protein